MRTRRVCLRVGVKAGLVAWALFHVLQPVLVLEPLVVNTIVGPVMLDLVQEESVFSHGFSLSFYWFV